MNYIQTVKGKVSVDEIKYVDSHTHLIAYATETLIAKDVDLLLDRVDKLETDISEFKELGGNTIVEMTTMDYRRDVSKLLEISSKYDINVIACSGFNKGAYNRVYLENADIDEVSNMLVNELTNGVEGTGIIPGVIKIGTSLNVIEPWEEKGIRAISRAHKKTGVPIVTHTQGGTMGLEQLEIFHQEGVISENIVICHLDQLDDYDTHRELLLKGVYLSYDSIAKEKYQTKQRAIDFICKLAKEGLHYQILVGSDFARRSGYKGYGGNPGFIGVFKEFKEELEARLIEEGLEAREIIQCIYSENPKRAFRIRGKV